MDEIIKFPTSIIAKQKGFNIFNQNEFGYAYKQKVYDPEGNLCWLSYDAYPHQNIKWFQLTKNILNDRGDKNNYRQYPIKSLFEPSDIETYLAPTQTTLHRWLRENFFIDVEVKSNSVIRREKPTGYICTIYTPKKELFSWELGGIHQTFELALEYGLLEALKLIPVSIGQKCSFMIDTESFNGEISEINKNMVSVKLFDCVMNNVPISNLELK